MIVSKRDDSSIFDGCLNFLKNQLETELPDNKQFTNGGIMGIVGSVELHNVFTNPYNLPPTYVDIYFGKNYIFPIKYALMGRRNPNVMSHYLKGWNFFGKN